MKYFIMLIFTFIFSIADNKVNYYKTRNNLTVGITNKIIIKLNNNQILDKYLIDFNLTKVKRLGQQLFLVKIKDNTLMVDIANQLNQTEGIKYAHPDYIKQMMKR